jgi:hypothetical protein
MGEAISTGSSVRIAFTLAAWLMVAVAVAAALCFRSPPLPTWKVTAVRYHKLGVNWRQFSASATLLVNLTVHSPSMLPIWFERATVDLFFPGPQGQRRPLGVGSFGGIFLNRGENYLEVSGHPIPVASFSNMYVLHAHHV